MSYSAEIIAVGTELLLGNIVNTNARDISEGLSDLGLSVYHHTVVGDNPERLRAAVEIARARADIIITTGGLGPTYDDLTKETLAACFGKDLVYHEEIGAKIRAYFADQLTREMPENNMRQAYLPAGALLFENGCGTAPGCAFRVDNTHVLMLPGPPEECRAMFQNYAMPYLQKLSEAVLVSQNIHIFGIGESAVDELIAPLMQRLTNPTLAPYADLGEMRLRLTARAETPEIAKQQMRPVLEEVRAVLGDFIYGIDVGSLENADLQLLRAQGKTIATAESCTGGLLAKRLTDTPGASDAYLGGVSAYANAAKTELLGVDAALIEAEGAVSHAVAVQMAEGIRHRLGADIGIGITGIAGPGGAAAGKPVGTVFVAMATADETKVLHLTLGKDRARIRTMAGNHALDMVRRYLQGLMCD